MVQDFYVSNDTWTTADPSSFALEDRDDYCSGNTTPRNNIRPIPREFARPVAPVDGSTTKHRLGKCETFHPDIATWAWEQFFSWILQELSNDYINSGNLMHALRYTVLAFFQLESAPQRPVLNSCCTDYRHRNRFIFKFNENLFLDDCFKATIL